MITTNQATEFLDSVGLAIPGFMLGLLVERANSIQTCLDNAGYDTGTASLIQLYLVGLFGAAQGDKYVTQQHAASGASQSYQYRSQEERYRGILSMLESLDTSGCASSLIPANPTASHAALFVGKAGCTK